MKSSFHPLPFSTLAALLLSAAFALPAAAGGQLYKWTDANGRVQYSDAPPPHVKAEALQGRIGTSSGSAAAAPSFAEQEQAFRKRRAEAEEADLKLAKENTAKKNHEAECTRTKASLAGLDQGGRTYELNEKGEKVYFDKDRFEAEKERLRKVISENC